MAVLYNIKKGQEKRPGRKLVFRIKGLKHYLWALRWGIDCSGLSVSCEGSSVCETVRNNLTLNEKGEGEKIHDFDDYGNPLNLLKKCSYTMRRDNVMDTRIK